MSAIAQRFAQPSSHITTSNGSCMDSVYFVLARPTTGKAIPQGCRTLRLCADSSRDSLIRRCSCRNGYFRITALALNAISLEIQAIGTGNIQVWHRTVCGLDFGDIQRVETRQGTAYVREATPTVQLWKAWRKNKDAVKAAGSRSANTMTSGLSAFGLIAKTALCRSHPRDVDGFNSSSTAVFNF